MKSIGHFLRTSAAAVAISSVILCNAYGLSIGEAVLLSRLGEPLHAEVALQTNPGETIAASCLSLAAAPDSLKQAKVTLRTEPGRNYAVIRSPRPVYEPYITVRLLLQCPGMGSLEKTLTLLPDIGEKPAPQPPMPPATTQTAARPAPEEAVRPPTKPQRQEKTRKPPRLPTKQKPALMPDEEASFTFRLSAGPLDASRIGKPPASGERPLPPVESPGLQLRAAQFEDFTVVPAPAASTRIPEARPALPAQPPSRLDNRNLQRMLALAGLLLAVAIPWLVWRRRIRAQPRTTPQAPPPPSHPLPEILLSHAAHAGTDHTLLEEAELYAIHGHPEKAAAILQEMVRRDSSNEEAWLLLFSIYSAHRQGREFENSARAFQRHNPRSPSWKMVQALGRTVEQDNPLYAGEDALGAAAPFLPHIALGKRRPLGDILVEMGFISSHELEEWLSEFEPERHGRFGNYLVSHRMISHNQLNAALLKQQEENAGSGGLPTLQEMEKLVAGFDPQRDGSLGEFLVSRNLLTPEQLGKVQHQLSDAAQQETPAQGADDPSLPLEFYPAEPQQPESGKPRTQ